MRSGAACPLCRSGDTSRLPDPALQSMTSDWRVTSAPLGKLSCLRCGLAYRDPALPPPADFVSGYQLYAHAAGILTERTRQAAYATWIAESVRQPTTVLDVGCGNGSLLIALRELWPDAGLSGCDPSPASVKHANDAGIAAWTGTSANLPTGRQADLVISVNVIEHTRDPEAFVVSLRRAVAPGGQLVLICPDAGRPGVELLIADHLYSFTVRHLSSLLSAAGVAVDRWSVAPSQLGAFHMVVGTTHSGNSVDPVVPNAASLQDARRKYLESWARLDSALTDRLPADVVCFGAGEAAGLLRAYAPRAWSRVRACTTDEPRQGTFGSLPRVPVDSIAADTPILVAVRPQDQVRLADRLRARFPHIFTWYDLVQSDGS